MPRFAQRIARNCLAYVGIFAACSCHAETVSVPLPALVGQYFDTDPPVSIDGLTAFVGKRTSIAWIQGFDYIEEVRIRVSGTMSPSKWQLFDNSGVFVPFDPLETSLEPPMPHKLLDEWSELPGFNFFVADQDDWSKFLSKSVAIRRNDDASMEQVEFEFDLLLERFMSPSIDAIARQANVLEFQPSSRYWIMDMSSRPRQLSPGIINIESARIIVTGTPGPNFNVPEPSVILLVSAAAMCVSLGRCTR